MLGKGPHLASCHTHIAIQMSLTEAFAASERRGFPLCIREEYKSALLKNRINPEIPDALYLNTLGVADVKILSSA